MQIAAFTTYSEHKARRMWPENLYSRFIRLNERKLQQEKPSLAKAILYKSVLYASVFSNIVSKNTNST